MLALALANLILLAPPVMVFRESAGLTVTSPEAPGQTAAAPFRATEIIDLEFSAAFRSRPRGDHLLELKVYTPNGKLYQVLVTPFTSETPRREGRRVDGFPAPLREQTMREKRRGNMPSLYHVTAQLPVAGTWIVSNSLYGQWRVDAYLDRAAARFATASFSIEP